MNKNNVKITKGIFRGELGELHETFKYHGKTLYVVRMYHIGEGPRDKAFYYAYTTLEGGDFEYIK